MQFGSMTNREIRLFLGAIGVAAVLFGTVIYGLVTGHIPTYAGEHKQAEVIWRSRAGETGFFWASVVIYVVLGLGAVWFARDLKRRGWDHVSDR